MERVCIKMYTKHYPEKNEGPRPISRPDVNERITKKKNILKHGL